MGGRVLTENIAFLLGVMAGAGIGTVVTALMCARRGR